MITENTLLILGAGASKPYGYPTAAELRVQIIKNLLKLLKTEITSNNQNSDFDNLPFIRQVKDLIYTFDRSSTSSIDLFLTRNQKYYRLGKEIIAFLLAHYESNSKFREEVEKPELDWYSYLYNIMTEEITSPTDIAKFADNKISILTFNYDRSFEHFFYESLFNSFTTKRNEIQGLMHNFKLVHVYGKLAPLKWEGGDALDYQSEYLRINYEGFASNIKIIYDERNSVQAKISTMITEAKNIFFLGFGYAEENLKALGLDNPILHMGQRFYGTALGSTKKEITKVISLLRKNNSQIVPEKFNIENCDTLTLLKNHL